MHHADEPRCNGRRAVRLQDCCEQLADAWLERHAHAPSIAGAPNANASFFCDAGSGQCFAYVTAPMSQPNASAFCAKQGGSLVAYTSASKQLMVEVRLGATCMLGRSKGGAWGQVVQPHNAPVRL